MMAAQQASSSRPPLRLHKGSSYSYSSQGSSSSTSSAPSGSSCATASASSSRSRHGLFDKLKKKLSSANDEEDSDEEEFGCRGLAVFDDDEPVECLAALESTSMKRNVSEPMTAALPVRSLSRAQATRQRPSLRSHASASALAQTALAASPEIGTKTTIASRQSPSSRSRRPPQIHQRKESLTSADRALALAREETDAIDALAQYMATQASITQERRSHGSRPAVAARAELAIRTDLPAPQAYPSRYSDILPPERTSSVVSLSMSRTRSSNSSIISTPALSSCSTASISSPSSEVEPDWAGPYSHLTRTSYSSTSPTRTKKVTYEIAQQHRRTTSRTIANHDSTTSTAGTGSYEYI
ncbi:uncharacterized protein L969DRAFT_421912 [Mixia osmundae IAM 14324]|uniref:Uncharacterized protein n=1 Tax=Mixia osmundae (strain CBS 9802 / IAM 14324 / JCM 22182 / KY 12970) TaxID=764103 RepID=G7EA13_MIXOS|nr:uncharacterized protein L969DRAFT_421912 [Mixia osmundae IAM 14324]KEI40360.1 hypothetical protein L969DRAFT_421912 [Mixia osmundae IAM 14324]GAA99673.1 hypothetical protein E5Q_06376 [Mixia osmundae IAM 14324]